MGLADQARDKAKGRRSTAHQALPHGPSLEEAVRQVGADILTEPIPPMLLQALNGKRGETKAEAERRE